MNREMFNSPIGDQRGVNTETPNHIINPVELAEVQKQAHILKGIIYAMGRNDSEMNTINNVVSDTESGKITPTEALNQLNKIQEIKNRGDYN